MNGHPNKNKHGIKCQVYQVYQVYPVAARTLYLVLRVRLFAAIDASCLELEVYIDP